MEDGMDLIPFKKDFLASARIIVHQGLADAFAHISIRLPEKNQMLFMPAKSPALVQEEDLFVIGLDEKAPQSSIHTAIYHHRPDVGAVIHTHPPRVVSLSILGRTVEPLHNYSAIFHEGVPLFDRPGQVGDQETAEEIVRTLGGSKAVIQKGHGALTVGRNVQEACLLAIFLEESAKYTMEALAFGEPKRLSPEEAKRVAGQAFRQSSVERGWEHFKSLALRQFPV
jgi:ribulose-5-phosphate 4-epimerase/fuculose-1-phosphate aldolase